MKFFKGFDFSIPFIVLVIASLGVASLWSLAPDLFLQQLIFILLGFVFFFIFSQIDFRVYENLRWLIYLGCILLLILTFALGFVSRGSARWLELGPVRIQPSEIVKPFLIVFFSFFFTRNSIKIKNLPLSFLLLTVPLLLVFKQPDLGSALVLGSAFFGVLFTLEISTKILLSGLLTVLVALPSLWFFLADYQKQRITSFLNPSLDPLGAGYNLIQAMISAGSGEVFGRGLGRGTQSHLSFLPEHHTDFIFASFVEEMGFVGAVLLLFLYFLLLWQILKIVRNTKHNFARYFGLGVFTMLLFQIFVNVGMNLGVVPVAGITLPLFSYGGSSVLATMICLGMVESIAKFQRKQETFEIR